MENQDGTLSLGDSFLPGAVYYEVQRRPISLSQVFSGRIKFDRPRFFELYEREKSPFGPIVGADREGLEWILDQLEADTEIKDVRWMAYMLGTMLVECRNKEKKWQPIAETGKGAAHRETNGYGLEYTAVDWDGWPLQKDGSKIPALPPDKAHHKPYPDPNVVRVMKIYYGRGFVQITWQDNYRRMGDALGLGNSLVVDPDLALERDIAYRIASYGMRRGSFRHLSRKAHEGGDKLEDYISGAKCDYYNARNIINGKLDSASVIEGYAKTFEKLLQESRSDALIYMPVLGATINQCIF
jgi:hypothetical protein